MKFLTVFFIGTTLHSFSQSIPEAILADWNNQLKNGGKWVSKDNTGDYDAWGMDFSWGLARKSLDASLYAIKNGKNVGTIWQFKVFYHPEKQQVIIDQWGTDGTFGHGTIQLLGRGNSESVSTFFNPDGSSFTLKHVQRLAGDTKYSDTFLLDTQEEWVKRQSYIWRRQNEEL